MKKLLLLAAAVTAVTATAPASAQSFTSTFESVPGGPGFGGFTTVAFADGWTGGDRGIELQNHAAGNPALTGGDVFVELDTNGNSFMTRELARGTYDLSFLYSARPGFAASTQGIEVLLGSTLLGSFAEDGQGTTAWSTKTLSPFTVGVGGGLLTFRAVGTSDGVGGYVDNITAAFAGVPEPSTWALMILGFGAVGGAMRRRRVGALSVA
ncbi:PEPxxWA-CTERM sorting domain-containing protein [Sphingomonas sp.]|uniref:PEPxxWA-CTERM sorting domain-containing protein n=1 Tax=Sphingomonas sp. TaxID=28214 RepID=UPI003AFFE42B